MQFEDIVETIQVSRQALGLGKNPAAVSAGTCSYTCANSSDLLEHYGIDQRQGFGWDLTLPGRASKNRGGLSKPFQEFSEHRSIAAVLWMVGFFFLISASISFEQFKDKRVEWCRLIFLVIYICSLSSKANYFSFNSEKLRSSSYS